jgi:glycosyltransferase involved in cell wall biosynthesis
LECRAQNLYSARVRIAQLLSKSGNGASRYCLLLSQELAARGHEVTLFFGGERIVEPIDLTGIRIVKTTFRRHASELRRVHLIMNDLGIDMMHTHLSSAHAFGALLRVFYWRRGLAATAHARHIQLHWAFNDLVIAPSQPTAAYHHRYNLVLQRRLRVISNFTDVRHFSRATPERRRAARAALRLPDDAFVIGCVGAITGRKNQSELVRTMAVLARRGVPAHLLLVGGVINLEEGDRIRATVAEADLGDRVHLLGMRSDVSDLLSACDVYAQTSRREELPLGVLEAMATGLPIFGTNVGGVPEVVPVVDRQNLTELGDVEGLADRLAAAARSPAARQAMSDRLPQAVAAVSPDIIIPQIESAFEDVMAVRRRRWGPTFPAALAGGPAPELPRA